jgi:cytochrome c553
VPRPHTTILPATPNHVDKVLAWDNVLHEYIAKHGDTEAVFSFGVTNISGSNVVINWVRPSCGCTAAKLPPTPWTLKPGESGRMDFTLDLKGKYGTLYKYISVDTSHGQKMLNIRATIPEGTTIAGVDSRIRNMQLAMADRQIVFRGDCARCHSTPLIGKTSGKELYELGCGICHDAVNRATMVPDLAQVANPGTKEYWQLWIRHGKPGTLMPAFASHQGGPLSEAQIEAVSAFLLEKYPAKAKAAPAVPAATANPAGAPSAGLTNRTAASAGAIVLPGAPARN